MGNVAISATPILQFLNNAGQPNVGGSLLTQVGGVNYPTYQDPAGMTPLPNPIPLNSRGEISNSSGVSSQLYLLTGVTYTGTLFDQFNNQIWIGDLSALSPVAVGTLTDEKSTNGSIGFTAGVDFTAGTSTTLTLSQNYGSSSNLWVAFDAGEQGGDTFTLGGVNNETLTFNAPIPLGTLKVYVKGGTTFTLGTPSTGTVTDLSVSPGSALYQRINGVINVKDPAYGALGNGVANDTVAINKAFQAAFAAGHPVFFPSGTYMVSDTTSAGYALLNPGVSMYGDGHNNTIIAPLPSMPSTSDFMLITPPAANDVLDFMYLRDFLIYPGLSGTKYGQRAIYVNTPLVSNAGSIKFSGVYCAPGNAVSMEWDNSATSNPQGCPANTVFENCAFWEGTKFVQAGDSIHFRDCVLRSTSGSGRMGVNFTAVNGSGGVSACLSVETCNISCDGGAATIFAGYKPRIANCNIEQPNGTGSPSGSVIDIDGGTVACNGAEVVGNAIGIFGTANVNSAIRINTVNNATVEDNRLTAGIVVPTGIFCTANSNHTNIGGGNELSTNFTTPINNLGVFTSGIRYPVALANSFTNSGGGAAIASVSRNKEGKVQFEGLISNAGAPSNTQIFTLPTGFAPASAVNLTTYGVVAGSISLVEIAVNTNGTVVMFSLGTVTQLSLSGLSYDTLSYFSSNV
jgi:hypothetical protein